MALATTCPQCKTSFKVIPDQLKLRRGLVRCGVCQHVFSGIDYLRYVDDSKAQQRKPADAAATGVVDHAAPGATDAGAGRPVTEQSVSQQSVTEQSVTQQSVTQQSVTGQPAAGRAGSTTAGPAGTGSDLAEPTPAPPGATDPAAARTQASADVAAEAVGDIEGDSEPVASTAERDRRRPGTDDDRRAPWPFVLGSAGGTAAAPADAADGAHRQADRSFEETLRATSGGWRNAWGLGLLRRNRAQAKRTAHAGPDSDWPAAHGSHLADDFHPDATVRPDRRPEPEDGADADHRSPAHGAQRSPPSGRQWRSGTPDRAAPDRRVDAFDDDAAELSPHTQIASFDDDDSLIIGRDALIRHRVITDDVEPPAREPLARRPAGRSHGFDLDDDDPLDREFDDSWRSGFQPTGRRPDGRRRARGSTRIDTFGDLVASPARRFALIGLVMLALVQSALCFRDELASSLPITRPLLAALGAPFGLVPEPVRSIGDLSIESFEIQAGGQDDQLSLSAVIRNRSERPVRWPAMELTLSDPSRAVVVRKVIEPGAYLPRGSGGSDGGIGPRSEQPIRLVLETRDLQLAGYTVALFYP